MAGKLQQWRRRNNLTQVEAAALLGVSQTYLSLLEKGARPLTAQLQARLKAINRAPRRAFTDERFRAQLSALGYPGFAHIPPARSKTSPDGLLLAILSQPDADARIVQALPWLVRQYADQMDVTWLVRQAKLQNLQNRLGFLLQAAGAESPAFSATLKELDRARLLQEATLCWDSMPAATREWMLGNRSPLAEHWNVVTMMKPEGESHVA